MTQSRLKYRSKAMLLLLIFFCMGGIVSHFVLQLMDFARQTTPNAQPENPEKKAEVLSAEIVQPDSTLLVSVSLPAPPSARSGEENPAQVSGRPLTALEQAPVPESGPATAFESHQIIDTREEAMMAQGLALLRNDHKDVPQIHIQFPVEAERSEQVINTLRACLGVTLGRLNEQGEVLVQESTGQPLSPFVRLVEGKLSRQEQQLASKWQHLPGTMVRFYPEAADARVLGGLLKLVHGPLAHKKISAEYHIQNKELSLINIKINGTENQTRLRLAKLC